MQKENEKQPVLVRMPVEMYKECMQEVARLIQLRSKSMSVPKLIVENLELLKEVKERICQEGLTDDQKLAAWDELVNMFNVERITE